ncbi:MAG TPA: hypothetical protein VNS81_10085 [Nocardioides sp.]|nr:hypothetical protein [Nocardioides sp.]
MGARLAVVAALLLLLAGCGSDDTEPRSAAGSPSATTTPSVPASSAPTTSSAPTRPAVPADAPRCGDVWVGGRVLPRDYKGCVAKGDYLRAEVLSCSSGQGIVRYDRRFWAVKGGRISHAPDIIKSRTYLDVVARCRG